MTYERNNTMVACVLAFIIVGGVALGALFMLGTTNFPGWDPNSNWGDWDNSDGTLFEFDRANVAIPDEITVNIDVSTGAIYVTFVDDPLLTYDVSIWVPNATLDVEGPPTVGWASDTITIDYPTCGVNITLGSNATYVLDLTTSTGAIAIELDNSAHIGNIDAQTTTGAISLSMTDDVSLSGDVVFDLTATTGAVHVSLDLPTGVGGHFVGASTTGSVDVTPLGWTLQSPNTYETSDYDTASDTVTITATTSVGAVAATLS